MDKLRNSNPKNDEQKVHIELKKIEEKELNEKLIKKNLTIKYMSEFLKK